MTRASQPTAFHLFSALLMMAGLPPFVYYLWLCVAHNGGALIVPSSAAEWNQWTALLPVPTLTAALLYLGWFLFQALLQIYAPGPVREGLPLAGGSGLKYKLNGWFSWWLTWGCLAAAIGLGWFSPPVLAERFGELLGVANAFAFGLSLFLFAAYRKQPGERRSGHVLYDYFMGAALNPRWRSFDWKFFCESRPGLIAWVVINASFAARQYELHGRISVPMLLVNAFQFLYIADYFFHEQAILSAWDIRHENFGWMLCWGDLVWVPFTYTLQAAYLVARPQDLPVWATAGIVVLNMTGYYIFRSANLQKHRFRQDPERPLWGRRPEFIATASGSPLLVSGWWGIARHANYLGDLMMGLAWCLLCGFQHPLPYFYIVYFVILLVHRERRDHLRCAAKYGEDWNAYCRRVPWRIIPGVY